MSRPDPSAHVLGRLIAIVPLGIGVTVLVFLWGAPFGEFHSPPLFFRVFGSFVALGFVLVGLGIAFAKTSRHPGLHQGPPPSDPPPPAPPTAGGYTCPHCNATLQQDAEASPLGDVKCAYCGSWFNIHGRKP